MDFQTEMQKYFPVGVYNIMIDTLCYIVKGDLVCNWN